MSTTEQRADALAVVEPREEERSSATEEGRCADCGAFTDLRLADRWICPACYEGRSSCCPEFGGGDET